MSSPAWEEDIPECPITATYVASRGGSAYALSADGDVYFFNQYNISWHKLPLSPAVGVITKISCGAASSLIATTSNNENYHFIGGLWHHFGNNELVALGDVTHYVAGNSDSTVTNIFKVDNGIATNLPSTFIKNIVQLSTVPALDHIWGITNVPSSNVFFYGGDWIVVPGVSLKQFHIHFNTVTNKLQVYGVNESGLGYTFNFTLNYWRHVTQVGSGAFISLESSNDYLWAATTNGVYRATI